MYRFRLETMLKLREQGRDERRRALAQAYEAERVLRTRVAEMEAEIEAARERTRLASAGGSVNVDDLLNTRRYELLVKSHVAATQAQIAQVLEEIERRLQALVEADRDVKVLEKLRQRQSERYDQQQARREGKQLDEAALRGFARRREGAA